jgi:hypothetical protein
MPGRAGAVASGVALEAEVRAIARGLGLAVRAQVRVGRRLWGAERKIDFVVTDTATRRALGIECKYQRTRGTAEEKLPAIIADIGAWPIPGIIVFSGEGFSTNLRQFLYSTGKAVDLTDTREWLQLFFGLTGEVGGND